MTKFKVGDRVKVVRGGFNPEKTLPYIGQEFTIIGTRVATVLIDGRYKVENNFTMYDLEGISTITWQEMCLELVKRPKIYHIGQKFEFEDETFVLAHVGQRQVALISLEDGNFWSDAWKVKSLYSITEEEFNEITANDAFEVVDE